MKWEKGGEVEVISRIVREERNTNRQGDCVFSSRRRDTSLRCEWSSDVCSSDLACTERAD